MKNLMLDWVADYERFQEGIFELSAEIDAILEKRETNKDIEETREFLADRYNNLQNHIDKLCELITSGMNVKLASTFYCYGCTEFMCWACDGSENPQA